VELRAWSPDGRWLLGEWEKQIGDREQRTIGLVSIDGHGIRAIRRGIFPAFAPDGDHLLWLLPRDGGPGIYDRSTRKSDLMCAPFGLTLYHSGA
jgi:hypothetical protein